MSASSSNHPVDEIPNPKRRIQYLLNSSDEEDEDDVHILNSTNKMLEGTSSTKVTDIGGTSDKKASMNLGKNLNTLTCPICFDQIKMTCVTPCGHVFCSDCIYQSLAHSKSAMARQTAGTCPLCRKRCKQEDITYLQFKQKPST